MKSRERQEWALPSACPLLKWPQWPGLGQAATASGSLTCLSHNISPYSYHLLNLLKAILVCFFYLQRGRERERRENSHLWLILQMTAMARTKPGQNWKPELNSGPPCKGQGPTNLSHQGFLESTLVESLRKELEQLGLEPRYTG